eukprot:CAMPEP_0172584870 /NCGR_PEP_ID=MMETSP1068-20121228/4425_1 /TAXON_ID=35684 /ORGANISM="Pseudopedinella elastica, Strain CCMP716" /LENGTH=310 /DNA_ID=CAMNT_0013379179 /DNA_START=57 /DNA_END=989 /DNA_ORIENTATION=+
MLGPFLRTLGLHLALAVLLGLTTAAEQSNLAPEIVSAANFDLAKLKLETQRAGASTEYHYYYDGEHISPWHDIPFSSSTSEDGTRLLNFVCEIAKGTREKREIHKSAPYNPIIQDVKKGKPRDYLYGPSLCNYGAIAQTWEDPMEVAEETGQGGDNDPIDVLQVNSSPCRVGEVMGVRVLGTLALVDGGETDWKIIVADPSDPETKDWKDIGDVPKERVDELREWFRNYKTAEGKGLNEFALDEEAMGADFATKVAQDAHRAWAKMGQEGKCEFDAPKPLDATIAPYPRSCWAETHPGVLQAASKKTTEL